MDLLNLLKDYPAIGASLIALISAFAGGFFNNIFQLYKDRLGHKRELNGFILKEKIHAAKKASEYYLEQLNYYNLIIQQLNFLTNVDNPNPQMIDDLNKQVEFYSEKLKKFPHFKHHHINIFYEIIDEKSIDLISETFKLNQEILDLKVNKEDSLEIMENKIGQITVKAKRQKEVYEEHYKILKGYLKDIRNDIKKK